MSKNKSSKARNNQPDQAVSDNQSLVMALLESAALVERRLDSALANICGISFSEYRLLLALNTAHEATATRVDVARHVGLTPSAVTRAFKPLEKLGFIRSAKSDRDARRSLATLTAAGLERVSNAQGVVADQIAELPLAGVPAQALQQLHADLLVAIPRSGR
jgi:DNA-binding MarR family transcriptional regulator